MGSSAHGHFTPGPSIHSPRSPVSKMGPGSHSHCKCHRWPPCPLHQCPKCAEDFDASGCYYWQVRRGLHVGNDKGDLWITRGRWGETGTVRGSFLQKTFPNHLQVNEALRPLHILTRYTHLPPSYVLYTPWTQEPLRGGPCPGCLWSTVPGGGTKRKNSTFLNQQS